MDSCYHSLLVCAPPLGTWKQGLRAGEMLPRDQQTVGLHNRLLWRKRRGGEWRGDWLQCCFCSFRVFSRNSILKPCPFPPSEDPRTHPGRGGAPSSLGGGEAACLAWGPMQERQKGWRTQDTEKVRYRVRPLGINNSRDRHSAHSCAPSFHKRASASSLVRWGEWRHLHPRAGLWVR